MHNAIYFDAGNKQEYQATVWADPAGLKIHIPGRELFWPHRSIGHSKAGVPGRLILKHGNPYAPDTLNLPEAEFVQALRQQRIKVNYLAGSGAAVITKVVLWLVLGFLVLLALAIAAWVLLMPKITEIAAKKIPRSVELQLAGPMLSSFLAGEKIDSAKTVLVNRFYKQHQLQVDIPVNITVVQSDVVNAFAIPGGELVVYTGLLNKLTHPGQLAALLGHEAGHVQYRHSLISLVRNLSGHLVLLILLQDAGIVGILAERAEWLQQLAYSRELELEADRFGLEVLLQNGYQPEQITALMQVLKDANPAHGMPDFLSTHPGADERILQVQETAKMHAPRANQLPDSAVYYWEQLHL